MQMSWRDRGQYFRVEDDLKPLMYRKLHKHIQQTGRGKGHKNQINKNMFCQYKSK